MTTKTGPSAAESRMHDFWDKFDRVQSTQGEYMARQLAERAVMLADMYGAVTLTSMDRAEKAHALVELVGDDIDAYELGRAMGVQVKERVKAAAIRYKDNGATPAIALKAVPGMMTVELPTALGNALTSLRAKASDELLVGLAGLTPEKLQELQVTLGLVKSARPAPAQKTKQARLTSGLEDMANWFGETHQQNGDAAFGLLKKGKIR
jgi:hypothetical protein